MKFVNYLVGNFFIKVSEDEFNILREEKQMQVDFHASSMAKSPKYTGVPKCESTSYKAEQDEDNYTLKTIGLNNSNEVIRVVYSTYENGRLVKEWADFDGDDKPDVIDSWEYDDKNNTEIWKKDVNGDKLTDCVAETKFDSHGNIIAFRVDNDMDSKPDEISLYRYGYDENGNVVSYFADYDGDGMDDYTEKLEYDENGNEVLKLADYGNTGFYDERITSKYNALGELTDKEHTHYYPDGSSDTEVYIYDGNGNLLKKAMK